MRQFFESEEAYQWYLKEEKAVNLLPLNTIDVEMFLSWLFFGE
jgi:hypothetical protein